jgi:sterol desaturase/sphingolipid hydroxylase (fatty acid hydroxylase superfamily)
MSLLDALNLLPPLTFVAFHALEAVAPARPRPTWGWRLRGIVWWMVSGAIVVNLPRLWSGAVEGRHLVDLSSLGLLAAPILVVAANFAGYWLHRARHEVPLLWRFHRLHHAAERLDVSGSFHFHPIESVYVAVLFSAVGVLLGATPEAAALAGWFGFSMACFQHANVRTPQWLGYLVQRPESHSIHHARGVHRFNYADLPLFDLLFGTFRNPVEREVALGFRDGGSSQVGRLLVGQEPS